MAPALPDVLNRMETGPSWWSPPSTARPWAAGWKSPWRHFRVALAGAKLGLPEVNLGLLPGAAARSARRA